ncbi:MAG TPA: nickel pincer cofactor biosynthesis protein LarB [Syntrophales bacterium]|nr:nickel pincer cofactor biosynthesis protein LarB [Syntrophales bacterium]
MVQDELKQLFERIRDGRIGVDAALSELRDMYYMDVGCAKVDTFREARVGYPEVIFCPGKTTAQILTIFRAMLERPANILATRATEDLYGEVQKICPAAEYHPLARTITLRRAKVSVAESYIAVVTAGTSDLPVAEEAAVTAELFGNRVERIVDVGVAGIHRLFHNLDQIRGAKVIVAVAGMEGALPGIIGGLVDKPVIAVPTSVGYGASFQGLSALLTMLNSCAAGVCVVNIDNGFGAGYMASMINRLK